MALLSFAVLGFEVALTRLFAVLLRYHFAFLVISIALCGLGVGGYLTHWLRGRRPLSLGVLAVLFAVFVDVAVAMLLRVIFPLAPDAFWATALVVLVPFTFAGAFLAEAFARYSQWSGRLYAWDLVGAALAAIAIVALLQTVSAIDACLVMAVLAAVAGVLVLEKGQPASTGGKAALGAAGVALLLVLGLNLNGRTRRLDIPAVPPKLDADQTSLADRGVTQPLFTELGTSGHTSRIVDTRWNAFARTDVVAEENDPRTLLVYTNGNVPTNMVRWNGDLQRIAPILRDYPLMDWSFASAPLGNGKARRGRVLSIGPGGGLDALMALHYGAQDFEGAEINPSIVGLMRDYRRFNGGIYERPDVRVVTAEGRAYVREAELAGKRYALIYSALTKTATAGQGMALLESYIYTQNAYRDYWNALNENGQLIQVCDQAFLLARLFATAVSMLQEQGMSAEEAGKHIVLAADQQPGPYRFALIVQKTPFTSQQTFAMSNAGLERSLIMLWLPSREAVFDFGPFPAVASGQMSLPEFVNWWRTAPQLPQPIDVSPCDDNRPFVLDPNVGQLAVMWQLAAVAALLALGLAVFGWRTSRNSNTRSSESEDSTSTQGVLDSDRSSLSRLLPLLYFSLLGVGFMLVEIPLAQKIILPLGYPTLALTTILFSILLGGGIGAWFSQRVQNMATLRRYAAVCAVGVALGTVGGTLMLNQVSDSLLALPLTTRCLVVGAALLPLGFLLGTPFPAGMRLMSQHEAANIPLIWGLNGVASVVGSLCAAMFAKAWGFNAVLFIGAATYVVAAAALFLLGREAPASKSISSDPEYSERAATGAA